MRVLIVGVSTRAAAASAAQAGFEVIALDAYADIDQHASVRALSLPRDFGTSFSPAAIVEAARELSSDAVVYLSSLENHPKSVAALAEGRALWGNAPDVLRRVRDPKLVTHALGLRGIRAPRVITTAQDVPLQSDVERWMIKPRISGGGHGVSLWHPNEPVPRSHYLQEFVDGVPGSVVFVAVAGRGVVLGTSRQLIGESAFGVSGFRYCGNILNIAVTKESTAAAVALVDAVTDAFPLIGVGAIDFIATDDGLHPVEVNPRWSASMELVERARGISLFGLHADACARGVLPQLLEVSQQAVITRPSAPKDLRQSPAPGEAHGKAIVFAREDVVVGDTRGWLEDPSVRDVPRQGDHIATGQPICTVFAVGSDEADCHARLVERAERIYSELRT